MTSIEFRRLLGYWNAKKNAPPKPYLSGRSHVKGGGKGHGQILKSSYVRHNVPIEK